MQALSKFEDSAQVGKHRPMGVIEFEFLNRLTNEVFGLNAFFAMRFIFRNCWLEVKGYGKFIRTTGFEIGKLTQFVTRNHGNLVLTCCSLLEQSFLKWVVCGEAAPKCGAGVGNGLLNLLTFAVGDGGDLICGEAFYSVQDKGLAVFRLGTAQGKLNQSDDFVGVGDLFRSGGPA